MKLLVTGGSGGLAGHAIETLLKNYPQHKIVTTTRTPEKLANFTSRGVEVRQADFANETGLADAFAGVDRVLLVSVNPPNPGDRPKHETAAARAAAAAGVKHIIYTSVLGAAEDSVVPLAREYARTEAFLTTQTATSWTVLRSCLWQESRWFNIASTMSTGKFFTSAGNVPGYYNARNDFAEVAAHVLAAEDLSPYQNRVLPVCGDVALTQADMAQTVRDVLGIPLELVETTTDGVVKGIAAAGLPEPIAQLLASFDDGIRSGMYNQKDDGIIQRLTGHPPTPFRQLVEARKADMQKK